MYLLNYIDTERKKKKKSVDGRGDRWIKMEALPGRANNAWLSITLWMVWEDKEVDAGRPGSGAEDGDPLWVPTKVADVLIEPTQGLDLVQ